MDVFILLIVVLVVFRLIYNYLITKNESIYKKFNGKINKAVLTSLELEFFNKLKEICYNKNLLVFTKIRLADLIKAETYSDLGKIKSKHIDFIICSEKPEPLFFIELDDNSHNKLKNKENDTKKDSIFNDLGIKIIRIKINEIDNKLNELREIL